MTGESDIVVAQVRKVILVAILAWCTIATKYQNNDVKKNGYVSKLHR